MRRLVERFADWDASARTKLIVVLAPLFVIFLVIVSLADNQGTSAVPARTPSPTQRPASIPQPAAASNVVLDLVVWDDTEARPLAGKGKFEVWVPGSGSWFPDVSFGGDDHRFGRFTVGERHEFFVYPDGRDGTEIRVEFVMQADMISGSDRAKTTIGIGDTEVEVIGEAIPGISKTFSR